MTLKKSPSFPFRHHALALAIALASPAMQAANINVSGSCTLYNAIKNADSDTDTDGAGFGCPAGSGADVINLSRKSTHSLLGAGSEDGLPIINSIVTINGNLSTVDALGLRAFHISNTGNLSINKLAIKNGSARKGAGILNSGQLTLNDSTVSGNNSTTDCDYYCFGSYGGGIFNSGTATLTNSRIMGNKAYAGYSINGDSGRGGGIFNEGTMSLTRSKVLKNETIGSSYRGDGPLGGGIMNYGTMTITNSSISGNTASNGGGGILNRSQMTLTNSTVSGNTSNSGGGIYNGHFLGIFDNNLTIDNSTVANNKAAGGAGIHNAKNLTMANTTVSGNKASNSGGGIVNKGNLTVNHSTLSGNHSLKSKGGGIFNLSKITLSNTLIANSGNGGDCVNSSGGKTSLKGINLAEDGSCGADIAGDPKLGLLLDNGGATATQALLLDSPALDVANKFLCASLDQRGIKRPQPIGGGCDIGAFERITSTPNNIKKVLEFFGNTLTSGGIVGIGNINQANQRSLALRNQLLSAGQYKNQNLGSEACAQLSRTLLHIDTNNNPDGNDYITGIQAQALVAEISPLFSLWNCQ